MRFLICSFLLLAGCANGPKVTVCIADGPNQNFQCRSPDGKTYEANLLRLNNWVCMSPDDVEAVLRYCKDKK